MTDNKDHFKDDDFADQVYSYCPKCNYDLVNHNPYMKWHSDGWRCDIPTSSMGEHLHYTCPECGFDWCGDTADAE